MNGLRRGSLYWYQFPSPDKKRPVLLLTRDELLPHLKDVIVAPLTTTIRNIDGEVRLTPDRDGVPEECVVNCHHLGVVTGENLGDFITDLSVDRLDDVARAILWVTGFDYRT